MSQTESSTQSTWAIWTMRGVVMVLLGLVVYVMLAVPTRRYLEQRSEVGERRVQLDDIRERNSEMEDRLDRLDDPEEIQRIARREYGLVTDGEESYTILPTSTAGLNLPDGWPFNALREPVRAASASRG